ncbi:MAG TPA: stress adaptor protein CpxP [Vibrio sp.]|nr:stress adaptor protein CpxP [Vibrio sp.]
MMMKSIMKKSVLVLLAAPLAFGSASALAASHGEHQKMPGKHGQKCGMGMERGIWKKLDLTETQKNQLKELRQKDREAMTAKSQSHKQTMKANHEQMQNLVMADNFDEGAVRALSQKIANESVDMKVSFAKDRNEMFNVLTSEQKAEFKKLKGEQHQQCMDKWDKMKAHKEDRANKKPAN